MCAYPMIDMGGGSWFAAFLLPTNEGRQRGDYSVAVAEKQLFTRHAVARLETGKATRASGFYRQLG